MTADDAVMKIAYITSRFPKLSETFILNEVLRMPPDLAVEIYPLLRHAESRTHPDAALVAGQVRDPRTGLTEAVRAHSWWLAHRPIRYIRCWAATPTLANWNLKIFLKSLWATHWAVVAAKQMMASDVQHIHAHWATYPAHAALVICRLTGIPFSFTAHAHDIFANAFGLREKVAEAAFVVTISDHNWRFLSEFAPPGEEAKIIVVRCGVDLSRFESGAPLHDGRIHVTCTGTLEEKKGQRFLIEALGAVRDKGVKFECTFLGDGPERSALEALVVERGLSDSVNFAGWSTSEEVRSRLQVTDIFVLPSIVARNGMMEGIPVALMEAMATEVPVVASDISGISELVIDGVNGFLVPPEDPEALARAVDLLARDQKVRTSMGRNGRGKVEAEYDLTANVLELAERFRKTIREGHPIPGLR